MGFFDFMTEDIAIDLGTANTLIIHEGKVVVDEPSIVARDRSTGKIIATGKKASLMQGKTHENIKTIRPLKDGVIADFEASEQMIKEFIKSIPSIKKRFFTPSLRMVICIPEKPAWREYRGFPQSAIESEKRGRRRADSRQSAHPRDEQAESQDSYWRQGAGDHHHQHRQCGGVGIGKLPGRGPEAGCGTDRVSG